MGIMVYSVLWVMQDLYDINRRTALSIREKDASNE